MKAGRTLRTLVFLLLVGLAVACGSNGDDPPRTNQSALVFVERDVRQSRSHLAHSAASTAKTEQLDAILAMRSRPTGIVYAMAPGLKLNRTSTPCSADPADEMPCPSIEGEAPLFCVDRRCVSCEPPEPNVGMGSGVLTSTTRLITAHHVV